MKSRNENGILIPVLVLLYSHAFIRFFSGKGHVLHKIRAHDMDIQGLSWCPEPFNVFEDAPKEDEKEADLLFAVSSRDKTFTVWSARTAMKVAAIMPAGRAGAGGGRGKYNQNQDNTVGLVSYPVRGLSV